MNLSVKVIPSSSRDCIAGWLEGTLKIKVSTPPEKGRANQSVQRIMEKALGLPRGSVSIIKGKTSVNKTLEIPSLSEAEVYRRLSGPVR